VQRQYYRDEAFSLLDRVDEVAERHGATPAQISLAWLLARPGITSPITSANTAGQWQDLAGAVSIKLSPEDVQVLDEASSWS
jgi:aryl-alcohol dehydrogenase-like predicted oxidoreductase